MKRRIAFSIALALSIVSVSLMTSDSPATAAPPQRFAYDTGLVTLGPNQELRVSVTNTRGGSANATFRSIEYSLVSPCPSGAICNYNITSDTTSDPVTLPGVDGITVGAVGGTPFRFVVVSNSPNLRVNVMIIDSTGQVVALIDIGDFTL